MKPDDPPSRRQAPFLQPLRKSRFGFDVELEAGEEEWLRLVLSNEGRSTHGQLKEAPACVLKPLLEYENLIANDKVENAAVWGADGKLRDRRKSRKAGEVAVDETSLSGGIMTHNHPAGNPPSFRDINNLLEFAMVELRVVTRRFVYRVQSGPQAHAVRRIENTPGAARWLNACDLMAQSMMSTMNWNTSEAETAALHSLLAWIATKGIILYERIPRP
ncbi:MAG: hypothetical protein U1F81_15855 [Verrucomicrobiaceae bacterium]